MGRGNLAFGACCQPCQLPPHMLQYSLWKPRRRPSLFRTVGKSHPNPSILSLESSHLGDITGIPRLNTQDSGRLQKTTGITQAKRQLLMKSNDGLCHTLFCSNVLLWSKQFLVKMCILPLFLVCNRFASCPRFILVMSFDCKDWEINYSFPVSVVH